MCFGGICEEPVSQPAQQVREAPASLAFPPHRLVVRHRAAFLRAVGGENPHRDSDQGHAAVGKQLQLALHAPPVGPQWRRRNGKAGSESIVASTGMRSLHFHCWKQSGDSFFPLFFFNYSSCCFCDSRATVLQMSHLNPSDGQIIFQMSRDWVFFLFFFAVSPSRGFLGGRGAYLLDPVWIFIMFVNCFVPFMKRFQPSLWENGREVSCLSVVVVVVVAVFLYDFFCTLLPYMALWMTGIFHKDLTCIWSPVVSEGSYFVIISTDKKMRLLIWFFRWIFFNVNIQKMRATKCVENVCTIIIFLHSYFLHILFCTCSLPSSDCVVLQLTQQSNDIFFSWSLNFLAPIFVTKDKILLD